MEALNNDTSLLFNVTENHTGPFINTTTPIFDTFDMTSSFSNISNITEMRTSFTPMRQTLAEKVIIYLIFGLFAFLGIFFNLLTIIVFTRGKRSSVRDIRILILNLAAVDMLYAISGPIPSALEMNGVSFVDSEGLCKLYRFTYILSAYGSPLANLAIAIERLIILYSPARTLRLRNRQTVMLIIIGSLWAFNLAITAEYLVSPIIRKFGKNNYCISNTWINREYPEVFSWLLVVKFCVPSLLIMIIYIIITLKLTMFGPIGVISLDPHLKKQSKVRNQMVKMLTIVAIITLVAYLPYNLYTISYQYEDPLDNYFEVSYYLDIVLFGLQLTNGFTSPIVYMVFDRYFKRDLRDMFGCCAFISRSATSQPTQTTTTARTIRGNGGNAAGGSNANRSIATVIEPETTTVPDIRPKKSKKRKASERTWLKATKSRT